VAEGPVVPHIDRHPRGPHDVAQEEARKQQQKFHRLVLKRDNRTCQNCFRTEKELEPEELPLEAHHIMWLSKGGTNDPENGTTYCKICHKMIPDVG